MDFQRRTLLGFAVAGAAADGAAAAAGVAVGGYAVVGLFSPLSGYMQEHR